MRTTDPRYGKGVVSLFEADEPPDIAETLRRVFHAPGYVPPVVPKVALELHQLARAPDVDLQRIARLLESDPLLAADVVRQAQSSLYSRGAPLSSLREALTRLGLVTVSNMFLQAAMTMRVFRAPGYERAMDDLRRHAVATAHIAGRLARRTSLFEDYAFLCGLLHDVGAAAALVALSEGRGRTPPSRDVAEVTWMAVLSTHEELVGVVGNLWKLPPDVQLVLRHHHQRRVHGVVHPLVAILAVAEHIAHDLGFGVDETADDVGWALEALGLRGYDALVQEAAGVVAQAVEQ